MRVFSAKLHGVVHELRQQEAKVRQSVARRRSSSSVSDVALFWDAVSVGHPHRATAPVPSFKAVRELLAPHGLLVERRLYHDGNESTTEFELAGFTVVACHGNTGELASKLAADAMHFAWHRTCMRQPAVVGLVSQSASHAYLLHRVRDLGVKTLLLQPESHSAALPRSLVSAADAVLNFSMAGDDNGNNGPDLDCTASFKTSPYQADLTDQQQQDGKLKEWWALEPEEKLAAKTLGYDHTAWDEGQTPSRCRLPWMRLTEEDRSAAIRLGYSPAEWDTEVSMLDSLGAQHLAILSAQDLQYPDSREFEYLEHHAGIGSVHSGVYCLSQQGFSNDFDDAFSDDIELGLVAPQHRSNR